MRVQPVQVASPSELNRSTMLTSQYTQNCYLAPGREGEHKWVAYDFPGMKAFYAGSGIDRGMVLYLGEIYKVSGTSLISISSDGTLTSRGTVPGSGQCIFAISYDDAISGYGLIIATDSVWYYYDQSTISQITDVDLTTGYSVAVMNDVAIFDNADGILTHTTNAAPTTVSSFFAETNTTPDGILRVYVWGQMVLVFGSDSIEFWGYNGATTEFIFTRQEQATVPVGVAGSYAVTSDETYVFFLGSDRQFKRLRGSLPESITTAGLASELRDMTTVSDCKMWSFKYREQSFVMATFPTEAKCFLYSATHNYWVNMAHGATDARYLANSYVYAYGKHYVADYRNGNVYELDDATYADAGDVRRRVFVMAPFTGAQVGLTGRSVTVGRLGLDMQVGVGLETGQGSDPVIMCELSNDGGKTFGNQSFVPIGELGDYVQRVNFDQFANGRSIVPRISCSDPVYLSIFGGYIEYADGGY